MTPSGRGAADLSDIRALTFDVFGTVVDWRTSITREAQAFGEKLGVTRDWAAFADDWRGLYQPAMQAIRSGERPFATLDVLHRENLDKLLDNYKLDNVSEAVRDDLTRAWHRLAPWPDCVAGLVRLKKRFILATLSNGNVALMVNLARHAGLPWDAILGAEIAQNYKPQPVAYGRTAQLLGLAPGQCMMVAAHNSDLAVARQLGFRTAYVNRPTEHGPGQKTDLCAEESWDVVTNSMVELAQIMNT
ncbi:MAG: haloacid dehalogenase type II [Alphaproteobacteria bacterium]